MKCFINPSVHSTSCNALPYRADGKVSFPRVQLILAPMVSRASICTFNARFALASKGVLSSYSQILVQVLNSGEPAMLAAGTCSISRSLGDCLGLTGASCLGTPANAASVRCLLLGINKLRYGS